MGCYSPIKAWYSKLVNKSGKRSLVFNVKAAIDDQDINISCGQCIGCRIMKRADLSTRCMHEASLHEENCFITLTYDDKELMNRENPHTVIKSDVQNFIKRLRSKIKYDTPKGQEPKKISYLIVGEYGDETERPHYHAIIFNHDFEDKELHHTEKGNKLYTSKELEDAWGMGMCIIGEVTKDTTSYVAGYTTKKITGEKAKEHYTKIDQNGEVFEIIPEFALRSTRPAIGKNWYEKYRGDVKKDFITHKGKREKVPKYYDKLREQDDDIEFDEVKEKREMSMRTEQFLKENTPERLKVKQKVKELQQKKYEEERGTKI